MEEDEQHRMVGQFSQLRVFAVPPIPVQVHPRKSNQKFNKMDGLVQDLNSALEESTRSSTSSASSKRKFLRRRCKSTCNLSTMTSTPGGTATTGTGTVSQPSDDSSTSSIEDQVGLGVSSRGERGTSSLQLTDSDEMNSGMAAVVTTASRKKRSESWNTTRNSVLAGNESDSHNENVSSVRPNTKRKRKFKRMAIDPAISVSGPTNNAASTSSSGVSSVTPMVRATHIGRAVADQTASGTIRRKKGRSKSAACEKSSGSGSPVASIPRLVSSPKASSGSGNRQRQSSGVVPGKRKRSTREKSVETDLHLKASITGKEIKDHQHSMDCDDERRSSSSLSSTEWEDQDSGGEDDSSLTFGCDDGEADDEQSDWHESAPAAPGTVYILTDDEDSSDMAMSLFANESSSNEMQIENFNKLTSTARQAYLARMKRLAECVPGREIRAGTRRIRTRQSGFTIKSSSSEQLSRFLQDPGRTQLRLSVLRGSDRNKIVHLANLYNLSLGYEEPHVLVLSKTGKTVKVDEFLVPKTPAVKQPIEVKRRRRTPPPTLTTDSVGQDCENVGMDEEDEVVDVSPSDFSEKLIFADDHDNDHQVDDTSVLNVAFETCST